MAANATQTSQAPTEAPSDRPFSLFLWALVAAVLLPAVAAVSTLPWARSVSGLLLLVVALAGVVVAAVLGMGPWARYGRWLAVGVAPLVAVGALYEIIAAARPGGLATSNALIPLLLAYLLALGALVSLLVMQMGQAWLALAATWATVMGAWSTHLTPQQVWWITWLLIFSLALLGVAHLRAEASVWQRFNLQREGPVLWPTARTISVLCLMVALIGVLPVGADEIGLLRALYNQTPFAHSGPLAYRTAQGTPVAILGAPLAIGAPNVASSTRIVSYTIQQGPSEVPPLLGATLDTFDGNTWQQSGTTTATPPAPDALPQGATAVKATITIYTLPEVASDTPLLLGFDQPVKFSTPGARAQVLTGAPTDALGVAEWSVEGSLAAHSSYTVTSMVIPTDAQPIGTLPPTLQQDLTAVPPGLARTLQSTAQGWAGGAKTPYDKATAIVNAMRANFTADASAAPPAGTNAVTWFLQNKRGNLLLWTTTFILLGRSIGLPMRLAEGYLPGSYDKSLNQMVVTASDATVWAQLAIPGVGWIDLYPGANLVPITLPANAGYNKAPTPTPPSAATTKPTTAKPGAPQSVPAGVEAALAALLTALVLLVVAMFALAALRLRRLGTSTDPLVGFFARLALLSRWAGVRLRASDTPAQATAKVAQVVPAQAAPLRDANDVYERLRYGRPEARASVRVSLEGLSSLWRAISRSLGVSALRRFVPSRAEAATSDVSAAGSSRAGESSAENLTPTRTLAKPH